MLSATAKVYVFAGLSCLASACTDDIALADDDTDTNTSSQTTNSGTGGQGDGDGDGDGGEGGEGGADGGLCKTSIVTEVEGCPETIGEGFCSEGGVHVDQGSEIEWTNNPPHSGDHYPTWESWGEHEEPVPRGNWVHNMEHGGLILLHNCPEACDAELEILRAVVDARPDARVLMTEDPLLDGTRFAATSWTWVHEFDEPDLEALLCFVDQHFNHAPENVP